MIPHAVRTKFREPEMSVLIVAHAAVTHGVSDSWGDELRNHEIVDRVLHELINYASKMK